MPKVSVSSTLLFVVAAMASACSSDPERAKQRFFERGTSFEQKGKFGDAAIEFRNAVKIDPKFVEAQLRLAEVYMRLDDAENAVKTYVRAADLRPADLGLQLKAGELLLLAGAYQDAATRAQSVLAHDAANVRALILSGNAAAGLQNLDAAINAIEKAIRLDPGNGTGYTNLGAIQFARGDRAQAEQAFKKALETEPNSVAAHLALANYAWATDQPEQAEQWLQKAAAIDPEGQIVNQAAAVFYLTTGRATEAERYLKVLAKDTTRLEPTIALADYYLDLGRTADAVPLLERLKTFPRTSALAESRLATIAYGQGQRDDAHRRVDAVLAKSPRNADALMAKAQFLLAEQKLDTARERTLAAITADPQSVRARYTLALINMERGDLNGAVEAFNDVLRIAPRGTDANLQLARLHVRKGDMPTALAHAREAVRESPSNLDANLVLAQTLIAQGDVATAQPVVEQLAAKHPDVAAVQTQLGAWSLLDGDVARGRRAYERALALDPTSVEALGGLVTIDLATGHPDDAVRRIEAQIAGSPSPRTLMLAAKTYSRLNRTSDAERLLRRVIDVDAANGEAYDLLARLYALEGKLPQAEAQFRQVAARDPRSVPAQTMVGMILHAQGRTADAQQFYQRALAIDPRAAVAANNLAWLSANQGSNLDVALQLAQTAKVGMPERPEVDDTLGYIYLKKGLTSLALRSFRDSVGRDPKNPVFQYHLGLAYLNLDDKARAREALQRAVQLKPEFDGAAESKKLLASLRP